MWSLTFLSAWKTELLALEAALRRGSSPAQPVSSMRLTSSGRVAARSSATRPPKLWATMSQGAMPAFSMNSAVKSR